ncbi:FMN-dependent NADH-azoreductase [[Acholeplasma] multilocale]|uniref:FMN-dependent NADH-azoreductase n=1 Tax=[Acholeplasma] multilocale TaxID=264638 RepID=UPI00047C2EEF|nr:FMN-dependent NADH-azoreductase [[Acholeplasma] multilocale]
MSKVLVITGTINSPENSRSLELTKVFLEEYKALNPNDEITIMDLNNEPMAEIALTNKNIGDFYTEENSFKYINQLKSMDKLIVAVPMHNLTVSGMFKNYLDHIFVPEMTFSYKQMENGIPKGLLSNLKVQILATAGTAEGVYPFANMKDWLVGTFKWLGTEVNTPIWLSGADAFENMGKTKEELVEAIKEEIIAVAKTF